MTDSSLLTSLGWSSFFATQVTESEQTCAPYRITSVQRDKLNAIGTDGALTLLTAPDDPVSNYAVGDWVLAAPDRDRVSRRLTPRGELTRRAAGTDAQSQLIASNVDTLFVVTSCNADFNIARLERYLTLAEIGGCLPVIVVTRADMVGDADDYVKRAAALSPLVTALALDARDPTEASRLEPWCGLGQTAALVGSSGVGKSTLLNGLTGGNAVTAGLRVDDAKGRHTTTTRDLKPARAGGWIIDTPGMRALRLTGATEGINAVFDDLATLAHTCRFSDCQHDSEPGCAIRAAIDSGEIDESRMVRWQKLLDEDIRNSQSLAQAHARDRSMTQVYKEGQARGRHKRGRS